MSTVTTDASPAPAFPRVVGPPGPEAETGQGLLQTDHAPLAAPGRGVPGRDVVYKIASRREEFCAAFGLVYKAYVRVGLSARHPCRMRVTPYHLLPTTCVFIAVSQGKVISTVSLIHDGELGLPMEAVYGREVARFRKHGNSLAEVSSLADHRQGQERSVPVVMRLMSLMAQCAERRGVDRLLIAVHPRHAEFYRYFAAFELIGKEKPYRTVCDNPAVAMALDLNWAPIDHPRLHKKFFGTPFPDEVMQYRPISDELRSELSLAVEANQVGGPCSELDLLAAA